MPCRALFPKILTRYICHRFSKFLFLCLLGLSFIYLLVEFFERLDNLMAQHLPYWVMIQYLSLRLPQVIFQILPVAILMATLLTLGVMARDGELIASLAGGISLYQMMTPLIGIFLGLSLLSGLYHGSLAPTLAQRSMIKLAQIKGERPQKKLTHGKIWLAGKQGRFFHLQFIDLNDQSLNGVTIFEVDQSFRLHKRWDIRKCSYRNGLWHLRDGRIWRFVNGAPEAEVIIQKVIAWPEKFSDFASLQKDSQEMGYLELKSYIRRLEEWGYKTTAMRTDLYFKWAFPLTCLIFGILGIPFACHLNKAVKYVSLGLSLGVCFVYWIIMYLAVSMAHKGIIHPIIGAWAGNVIFGLLGLGLILQVRT